mmetsp:Transcript_84408/g.149311  ORF Transcript_84408/g.149311 Transcript_84408/m.149311 type:complete len:397 (-) Transcript_84408:160-1350(-)
MADEREHWPLNGRGNGNVVGLAGTICNMISCLVGPGLLILPSAFDTLGYSAVLGISCAAVLHWSCALLLGKSVDAVCDRYSAFPRQSWDMVNLAHATFGNPGRIMVMFFVLLELWLTLLVIMVLVGIAVHISTGVPSSTSIMVAGLLGLICSSFSVHGIAALSTLAVCCLLAGLAILMCSGSTSRQRVHRTFDIFELFDAITILMYCFSGTPCLVTIHGSMKRPSQYPLAVHCSFAIVAIYYLASGGICHVLHGDAVWQNFNTQNSAQQRSLSGPCLLAIVLSATKLQATMPLYVKTLAEALGKKPGFFEIVVYAITIWLAILLSEELSHLIGFLTASLTAFTSVIIPCLTYASSSRSKKLGAMSSLMLNAGCVLSLIGSISASRAMHRELERKAT